MSSLLSFVALGWRLGVTRTISFLPRRSGSVPRASLYLIMVLTCILGSQRDFQCTF